MAGGSVDGATEPLCCEREPDVLHFDFLHSTDLSCPEQQWPNRLRLLRIDTFIFAEGAQGLLPEPEYGLLVASEFEEEKSHP